MKITPIKIENLIHQIRNQKVMFDSDLASLYEVETKKLIQAVKRNINRFPEDFMFQLTKEEFEVLRSQNVTSNKGRGGRRYPPYVFTQDGVAMLSSVLRSDKAIEVNIHIMRTFNRLRHILDSHRELASKLNELENKYDSQFAVVFEAIRKLMDQPEKTKPKIGFQINNNTKKQDKK